MTCLCMYSVHIQIEEPHLTKKKTIKKLQNGEERKGREDRTEDKRWRDGRGEKRSGQREEA